MTKHGNAQVRPDGKVNMSIAVDEAVYREIRAQARPRGMTAGELVEWLVGGLRDAERREGIVAFARAAQPTYGVDAFYGPMDESGSS